MGRIREMIEVSASGPNETGPGGAGHDMKEEMCF